ncbi:MAG: hypothetical protein Q7R96_02570 [Nanoarchaeota archaeon]|nr:hypothetical protein [Nanoarchaeota archaeon]
MSIRIPKKIFGEEVGEETVKKYLEEARDAPSQPEAPIPVPAVRGANLSGYIFIPTLGYHVSRGKVFHGKNWEDAHKSLAELSRTKRENLRMPTIYEFAHFVKYLRENRGRDLPDANRADIEGILDDILTVRAPYRAEWLDAKFVKKGGLTFMPGAPNLGGDLHMDYNHKINGAAGLVADNSVQLSNDVLMSDKTPGISIDSWLGNNALNMTHGLPKKGTATGDLYYWHPRKDMVARFLASSGRASLCCDRGPSDSSDGLGVRAVRRS